MNPRRSISRLVNPTTAVVATPGSLTATLPFPETLDAIRGRRALLPLGADPMPGGVKASTSQQPKRYALAAAVVALGLVAAGCGGASDRSAAIAEEIGATGCLRDRLPDHQPARRHEDPDLRLHPQRQRGLRHRAKRDSERRHRHREAALREQPLRRQAVVRRLTPTARCTDTRRVVRLAHRGGTP